LVGLGFSTDTHGIYLLPDCGLVTLLCLVKYLLPGSSLQQTISAWLNVLSRD